VRVADGHFAVLSAQPVMQGIDEKICSAGRNEPETAALQGGIEQPRGADARRVLPLRPPARAAVGGGQGMSIDSAVAA
jgi:hypothetical protein